MPITRDKGWRQQVAVRKTRQRRNDNGLKKKAHYSAKNWQDLWQRASKLKRAQRLGFDHPRQHWRALAAAELDD